MMDLEGAIAQIKNKDNAETFDKSLHSLQAMVDNLLTDGTHGLAALKTLIDAIVSDLDNGSYGLDALQALMVAIETRLDDGTTGLAALKALIDALEVRLDDGTYGLGRLFGQLRWVTSEVADHHARIQETAQETLSSTPIFSLTACSQAASLALSHSWPGATGTLTCCAKLPFRDLRCSGGIR